MENGLLRIQLLCILDIEAEEIHQLRSGVNFRLPCVLALAQHGGSHDLVSVFPSNQVGGL